MHWFLRQAMLSVVLLCLLRDQGYHTVHFLVTCHPDRREPDPDALRRVLIEELEHFRSLADRLVGGGRRDAGQLVHRGCRLTRSVHAGHLGLEVAIKGQFDASKGGTTGYRRDFGRSTKEELPGMRLVGRSGHFEQSQCQLLAQKLAPDKIAWWTKSWRFLGEAKCSLTSSISSLISATLSGRGCEEPVRDNFSRDSL